MPVCDAVSRTTAPAPVVDTTTKSASLPRTTTTTTDTTTEAKSNSLHRDRAASDAKWYKTEKHSTYSIKVTRSRREVTNFFKKSFL